MAGYVMRQFTCPKAVTHPSTNRARCRATALIETNALPLHQTANPPNIYMIYLLIMPGYRSCCSTVGCRGNGISSKLRADGVFLPLMEMRRRRRHSATMHLDLRANLARDSSSPSPREFSNICFHRRGAVNPAHTRLPFVPCGCQVSK